jgi:hypothetical protein
MLTYKSTKSEPKNLFFIKRQMDIKVQKENCGYGYILEGL